MTFNAFDKFSRVCAFLPQLMILREFDELSPSELDEFSPTEFDEFSPTEFEDFHRV